MAPPTMFHTAANRQDLEDAFINVWFDDKELNESVKTGANPPNKSDFYSQWVDQVSAKHSYPDIYVADALQKLYPGHSLVMSSDYRLNLLSFPRAYAKPLDTSPLVTNVMFVPLARRLNGIPGALVDQVEYGSFSLAWDKYDFIVYILRWPSGMGIKTEHFILHEGPEEPARALLLAAGLWQDDLHEEIWVFNQGYWQKDHSLWTEIQKADWKDVVLKDEFKKALHKDVYGFFASEEVYRQLAIPWKRGLIMYGPPGNGKTISIKAIMKTCDAQGFRPLYVKSFQSYMGEEGSMALVFNKARQSSPCVIVLEDLDSLINDRNRSFFLNQLDGLEGNDGLLIIGTTNHFDKLDPGLSTRPSRFDRKYLFDDPDREERFLYAKYWQEKLKPNEDITYPDALVEEVADSTEQFSFAYLKEAFVSSLVTLAGIEEDKPPFAIVLRGQIRTLRKQLDKIPKSANTVDSIPPDSLLSSTPSLPMHTDDGRDIRVLLDTLSDSFAKGRPTPPRIFTTSRHPRQDIPSGDNRDIRDIRARLQALQVSDSLPGFNTGLLNSDIEASRKYD